MTREEEIKDTANSYFYLGEDDRIEERRMCFIGGAQWADEHPKNPWRDAKKDPPKDDRDVFIKWGKNDPAQRLHGVGSYHKSLFPENNGWSINDVTHWMPIPELEKRGEK